MDSAEQRVRRREFRNTTAVSSRTLGAILFWKTEEIAFYFSKVALIFRPLK